MKNMGLCLCISFWPNSANIKANLLKVANRDEASTRSDSEFVFFRAPLDARGRSIDSQQYQRVTPRAIGLKFVFSKQ